MKPTPAPTLEDRIREIRAEIDAVIDARAGTVAKENPGVPAGVIQGDCGGDTRRTAKVSS